MHRAIRILIAGAACLALLGASPRSEKVVFAGGCFWGMQWVFEQLRGVSDVVAGYAGGSAQTAHYEIVSTGRTGHAESVEITYDPSKISYTQLLDVYFLVAHDPTELNYQGPDEGTQYRSEIYYTTNEQREESLSYISALSAKHVYAAPIVTKVDHLPAFYPAEDYHQDFAVHNPYNPYILINDRPKIAALRKKFPQYLKN
jgi:peptide-methionine (S)-S-oxide reductase